MKLFNFSFFRDKTKPSIKEKEKLKKRLQFLRSEYIQTKNQVFISNEDHFLIACDYACTKRNFPSIKHQERYEGTWFSAGKDFIKSKASENYHSTTSKEGKVTIDAYLIATPKIEYQASLDEVVWYYFRVKELMENRVYYKARLKIIKTEALNKPWLKI